MKDGCSRLPDSPAETRREEIKRELRDHAPASFDLDAIVRSLEPAKVRTYRGLVRLVIPNDPTVLNALPDLLPSISEGAGYSFVPKGTEAAIVLDETVAKRLRDGIPARAIETQEELARLTLSFPVIHEVAPDTVALLAYLLAVRKAELFAVRKAPRSIAVLAPEDDVEALEQPLRVITEDAKRER